MKKAIVMIIIVILACTTMGCKEELFKIEPALHLDEMIVQDKADMIVETIRKQEPEGVKKLFSEKVINTEKNFDKQVDEYLKIFKKGVIKYYYDASGPIGKERTYDKDDNEIWFADAEFDFLVYTGNEVYELSAKLIMVDDKDYSNEGLQYIHVRKVKKVEENMGSYSAEEYYSKEDIKGNGIIIK